MPRVAVAPVLKAMSYTLLNDLRIVEVSAFIAAPLAGLTLAQLGAEVIRIDPPGGGIDRDRWPLGPDGTSLYWAGLNRAKKSVALDLRTPAGQAVLHRLLLDGKDNGGILLTNLAGPEWMAWDALSAVRDDLILVELKGHHDGSPAVDYTVNSAVGVPFATGPEDIAGPVNHMLPAWDAIAGLSLATAVLAAVHARSRTGKGQRLSVALSDVAYAFLGNIGVMAETELSQQSRPRLGNAVFGAFGLDLQTRDGRYVMVVAITNRQWRGLVEATETAAQMSEAARATGHDFDTDGGRYAGRAVIGEILRRWSAGRDFAQVTNILAAHRVLWGPYQTFAQMMAEDSRVSLANPLIQSVDCGALGNLRIPGSPIRNAHESEGKLTPAPRLGADTGSVLRDAGYSEDETGAIASDTPRPRGHDDPST